MAGMGAAPKNPAERRRSNAPTAGEWVLLDPAGRRTDPPSLPDDREYPPATVELWSELWHTPQATMWDQSGKSLRRLAWLHADLMERRSATPGISAEMRQIEDRHGLSPKAMMTLRWKVGTAEDDEAPAAKPKARPASRRLKVVDKPA